VPFFDPLRTVAWVSLAVLVVAAPAAWARVKPAPPVPDVIRAVYQPGVVNVVEFADFECPYCRAFHSVLQGVIADYPKGKIRFVRKHAPLPSHERALPAARADVCAEAQGRGEELAARLVQIEPSPAANRRAALEVGVDPARFDQCMAGSDPDRRIDADSRLLERAGMLGLPTTYIEGKRLLGAVSDVAVRDAIDRALRGESNSGVPGSIYWPAALALLCAAAWLGRASRATLVHERST
jgi:protein-disulfide isomerase